MGFLESAVVIYIRELIYPDGFGFPLAAMESRLAVTEILREAATMVMLLVVGVMAGRNTAERFAWFIYSFAIWDIFYYLFLWLLIGWPANLMVWDVLFLIPVTWTGPVISPLIVCLLMILLAMIIIWFSDRGARVKIDRTGWLVLVSGSIIIVVAFAWDYSRFILAHYSLSELWNLPGTDNLFDLATKYIPVKFNWWLFLLGSLVITSGIANIWIRLVKSAGDK